MRSHDDPPPNAGGDNLPRPKLTPEARDHFLAVLTESATEMLDHPDAVDRLSDWFEERAIIVISRRLGFRFAALDDDEHPDDDPPIGAYL